MLAALGAFSAVAVIAVGVMVATGGVRNTLEALGLGKGSYLELGAIPYHSVLRPAVTQYLLRPDVWGERIEWRDLLITVPKTLLPVVAGLLVLAAWAIWARRSGGRLVSTLRSSPSRCSAPPHSEPPFRATTRCISPLQLAPSSSLQPWR